MSGPTHRPLGRLRLLPCICFQTIVCMVVLVVVRHCWASESNLSPKDTFDIAPQPLDAALIEFSTQAGVPVSVAATSLHRIKALALSGTFEAGTAPSTLLDDSRLRYEELGDTDTVVQRSPGSMLASMRVAGADPEPDPSLSPAQPNNTGQPNEIETTIPHSQKTTQRKELGKEIEVVVVTAQKRSESLQDVPVPVTALDAAELAETDQNRLQDYFSTVPGLSLNSGPGLGGQQTLAIRGVTSGGGNNPAVGITIDDVPYGSSSFLAEGESLYPDIDPGDLARIEVLRGPQGALYGASSVGGLIKFVTVDPSTEGVSGRMQLLGSKAHGGESGYGVRGAINLPLSDTFAVRGSAFTRRDPGYIENVTTGQKNVNRADVYGGRLSALWRPAAAVSLKLAALLQNTEGDGSQAVPTDSFLQPTLGDLKQATLRGAERYSSKARLYTATLTAKLAGLDFISISGYGVNTWSEVFDISYFAGGLADSFFGVPGASAPTLFETKKFTQEFRLSSASGQKLEWLLGTFYAHEATAADQFYVAIDPATGLSPATESPMGLPLIVDFNFPSTVSEYAVFGDLTVHFTDRFDVQLGGRESKNRQSFDETDTGPLIGPSPYVQPTERTSENSFTYLLTPRFKISPDLMVYARFASGYRVGGPNLEAELTKVPLKFGPDKTKNYELGVKATAFDRALTLDASVYYLDWKDLQIYITTPPFLSAYHANAGNAKSQGIEASLQARPSQGLTIAASATVNDAELTQDLPPTSVAVGYAGDRLPYSSRFSANLSAEQNLALTDSLMGFVGGGLTYVGAREGDFAGSPAQPRFRFPAYTEIDLRTGARFESWTVNLFVNNVGDRRGLVGGGGGPPYSAVYIRPRTVGLSLTNVF